ncbi:MAG TPA: DUF481 domain-containing protein [Bryobacteraceae bacterium]|nr:DUF481 domain-containing protein [Bryobacteraceae bacterium]
MPAKEDASSCRAVAWMWLALAVFVAVPVVRSQTAKPGAKREPDVLIFTDDEKLIGHLLRATSASVTFKSDMAGEITVEWTKIKELRTVQPFAVVEKNVKLHRREDTTGIPQGAIVASGEKIEVTGARANRPMAIAVANAAYVIDEATFEKTVLHNPGILEAWNGTVTGGASLVEATQTSQTFTGAASFIRAVPTENWMDARNRTSLDLSASYGKLTQPKTPTLRTAIYHAGGERDEYFTPRLYAFGQLAYDHNFSQGLDLQQAYGGGVGWTVLKNSRRTLDLKTSLSYVDQQFQESSHNQNLFGSTFAEGYADKFFHGIVFAQQLSITPAWNNTSAYSAAGNAGIAMPLYKRLSFSLNTADTFLNNPPPGFKKNSFQLTTGVTYTLH